MEPAGDLAIDRDSPVSGNCRSPCRLELQKARAHGGTSNMI